MPHKGASWGKGRKGADYQEHISFFKSGSPLSHVLANIWLYRSEGVEMASRVVSIRIS